MADTNHWSAWQFDEATIKYHVESKLELFCAALTTQMLWPALDGRRRRSARLGGLVRHLRADPGPGPRAVMPRTCSTGANCPGRRCAGRPGSATATPPTPRSGSCGGYWRSSGPCRRPARRCCPGCCNWRAPRSPWTRPQLTARRGRRADAGRGTTGAAERGRTGPSAAPERVGGRHRHRRPGARRDSISRVDRSVHGRL